MAITARFILLLLATACAFFALSTSAPPSVLAQSNRIYWLGEHMDSLEAAAASCDVVYYDNVPGLNLLYAVRSCPSGASEPGFILPFYEPPSMPPTIPTASLVIEARVNSAGTSVCWEVSLACASLGIGESLTVISGYSDVAITYPGGGATNFYLKSSIPVFTGTGMGVDYFCGVRVQRKTTLPSCIDTTLVPAEVRGAWLVW